MPGHRSAYQNLESRAVIPSKSSSVAMVTTPSTSSKVKRSREKGARAVHHEDGATECLGRNLRVMTGPSSKETTPPLHCRMPRWCVSRNTMLRAGSYVFPQIGLAP